MDREKQEKIAVFRFGVIFPLVERDLHEYWGEKERILRELVSKEWQIPCSGRKYSTWGKTRGTGLGVYSTRLMTETQGGTFSWNSSKEAGTTIRISLPAAG